MGLSTLGLVLACACCYGVDSVAPADLDPACDATLSVSAESPLNPHNLQRLADGSILGHCRPASIEIAVDAGVEGEPERTERTLDAFLSSHFGWLLASVASASAGAGAGAGAAPVGMVTYTLEKGDVAELDFLEKFQAAQYPAATQGTADSCRAIAFKRGDRFIGRLFGILTANMFAYGDSGMPYVPAHLTIQPI